jgi:KDO2-lipid IV(A) lauroyltransferase
MGPGPKPDQIRCCGALRAGRLVALVCDRDLTGHGLPVRMFGAAATIMGGSASLALKTGAPLLPAGVFHDRRAGRWVSVVRPPIHVEPSGDQRSDALALTQRLAEEFEQLISSAPEQWHMLSRYWRGAPGAQPDPQELPPPQELPTSTAEDAMP